MISLSGSSHRRTPVFDDEMKMNVTSSVDEDEADESSYTKHRAVWPFPARVSLTLPYARTARVRHRWGGHAASDKLRPPPANPVNAGASC